MKRTGRIVKNSQAIGRRECIRADRTEKDCAVNSKKICDMRNTCIHGDDRDGMRN